MTNETHDWQIEHKEGVIFFDGSYKGPNGLSIKGRIIEYANSPLDVFAYDVPRKLRKNHPHGQCWQLWRPGNKWFLLHWTKPAWDFETGKAYVEKMIREVSANLGR